VKIQPQWAVTPGKQRTNKEQEEDCKGKDKVIP
jgi:hypothetical protein